MLPISHNRYGVIIMMFNCIMFFAMSFCVGSVLSLSTSFENRGPKQYGFRKSFEGAGKEIDRTLEKEIEDERFHSWMENDVESHANKDF